jgi:hypothetical protein
MTQPWKDNWPETKHNFKQWWNREGLVIGMWGGVNAAVPVRSKNYFLPQFLTSNGSEVEKPSIFHRSPANFPQILLLAEKVIKYYYKSVA